MRSLPILTLQLWLLLTIAAPACLMAQSGTLKGKVVNARTGEPVADASILIKGTQTGSSTNAEGVFTLNRTEGKFSVMISHIGFTSQEVTVKAGQDYLSVSLEQTSAQGDEVVVIGYTSKSRRELTGSVVKINGDDIRNMPMASPDQLIQGKAAGVQISSMSGTPGGGVTVRVRGTSSFSPTSAASQPLYIIDGIFANNTPLGSAGYGTEQQFGNPLADLNPSDIASIEILKDANATAIYGSRGANGVVIITTKRGKYNSKSKINFNTYYGTAKAHRLPKVTNGVQTATLLDENWINNGHTAATEPYPNPSAVPTYDKIPYIFDNSAPTSNMDLNITGGDSKTSFYIGGSLFSQDGIVRPLSFDRKSVRFNLDHQVNDKFRISTSNTVISTKRKIVANDNSTGVLLSGIGLANLYPIYNADGTYNYNTPLPNAVVQIKESDETSSGTRIISNIYGEYQLLPRLYFKTSWSIDFNDAENRAFNSTVLNGPGQVASGYNTNNRQVTWINEQTLRYGMNLGEKHKFNFLAGNTVQKTTLNSFGVGASNYPNDDLRYLSAASQADFWSGGATENSLVSVFGRADYTYDNKYIFDVSLRGDASSKFGANHRWGTFPSAGFAWRVINETFMKEQHVFSELKFKASYGVTGSQEAISEYASKGLWTGNDNYLGQPGTRPSQLANPDLKWEQTTQFNAGLEFGLFKGLIEGEFNYYDKLTKGVLINKPVPMSTGFGTIAYNGGDISNKGVELSLNAHVIRQKDFSWDLGFNISHNKNLIKKLDVPYLEPFSRQFIIYQQGYAVNSFWLWKQLRVDPQTGDAVYEDLDKNGVIDDRDRMILGNSQPKWIGGLNSSLRYKGFDFAFAFNFETGQSVVNWSTFFMVHGGTRSNAANGSATYGFYTKQLERWQKPGDITGIPRMGGPNKFNNYSLYTSRAMEDGSYARLKNVTLGYTIPTDVTARLHISQARIYLMGTNLLTITHYSGLDPEINAGGGKGTVNGVEMFTVPQPESWQAGISVTF
ncbi:MAG TPA: TonB-dependent receptor [Puia sp.]|jgi:TonB-linked SusC/RagA family outer membrane protein|nr:TonB-dependent receptor [Puia sp.]